MSDFYVGQPVWYMTKYDAHNTRHYRAVVMWVGLRLLGLAVEIEYATQPAHEKEWIPYWSSPHTVRERMN